MSLYCCEGHDTECFCAQGCACACPACICSETARIAHALASKAWLHQLDPTSDEWIIDGTVVLPHDLSQHLKKLTAER